MAAGASRSGQAAEPPDFNEVIVRAVREVAAPRQGGGYDIRRAFTQDLSYGPSGTVPSSQPPVRVPGPNPTMCVAAVAEVIIEALNLYVKSGAENGLPPEKSVYSMLPVRNWRNGSLRSIRSHIFMYQGADSQGTADALETFGIGKMRDFPSLKPGDFINFNRTRTGHAVVFMGFLDASRQEVPFSKNVMGFRYFSAQGQGRPDGGMGYRDGWFAGQCPSPRTRHDDCDIRAAYEVAANGRVRQNQSLLNCGRMHHPSAWQTEKAQEALRTKTRGIYQGEAVTRGISPDLFAEQKLDEELEALPERYQDGTLGE
ncbi:hypothetical protein J8J14_24170 [Roseomonas sp. SSH11]|uniref:NlpC/P60 domain-containing protein n=1 Tax=Pararoseomonas baculiformis TaxID=2820812 RepID=A0ABS4ALC6_9PROT|nr:hypothetical protein [Pararoseomonas baculiformis]MBP0447839.1 hypothetical protein [Pararoseomonas baculiformis]